MLRLTTCYSNLLIDDQMDATCYLGADVGYFQTTALAFDSTRLVIDELDDLPLRLARLQRGIVKKNSHYAMSITAVEISPLKSVFRALDLPNWKATMVEEYDAMVRNDTWELVDHSLGGFDVGNAFLNGVLEERILMH